MKGLRAPESVDIDALWDLERPLLVREGMTWSAIERANERVWVKVRALEDNRR